MTEKELKIWFDDKLLNCYHITMNNGNIIWVYDKNYIRKVKLSQINGIKIETHVYDKDKVLFYQDQENKIFECSYKIWKFLEDNYSHKYIDNQLFIKERLKSFQNLKQFIPMRVINLSPDLIKIKGF